MGLLCCTITGADDQVDPGALAKLSQRHPFLEWGILHFHSHSGKPRYPGAKWRREFEALPRICRALHLCGQAAIEAFLAPGGQAPWDRIRYQRVQLNFRADRPWVDLARIAELPAPWWGGRIITQHNAVNAEVQHSLIGEHFQILFDASGGRGNLLDPTAYPAPLPGKICGYSGGIGPENVQAALSAADRVNRGRPFWIDMESGVRTDDQFDFRKVEEVAVQVEAWERDYALP